MEACGMTEREQSAERGEAERRELEAAGWEAKGRGPKTLWRNPSDGHWYAHYQAVRMLSKEGPNPEEARLLGEQGFERVQPDGTEDGRERWSRPGEGSRLYRRSQALEKARRESS
jgi:hypothetical protein